MGDFETPVPDDTSIQHEFMFVSNVVSKSCMSVSLLGSVVSFVLFVVVRLTGTMTRLQSLSEEGKARYDNKVNFKVVDLVSERLLIGCSLFV